MKQKYWNALFIIIGQTFLFNLDWRAGIGVGLVMLGWMLKDYE